MQAQVDLDSARTALRGAFIRTAHSKIELTARADTSMNNLMKRVPLIVQLNARVGLADLTPFYDGIPQDLKHSQVDLNTTFSIDENRVRFDRKIPVDWKRTTAILPGPEKNKWGDRFAGGDAGRYLC